MTCFIELFQETYPRMTRTFCARLKDLQASGCCLLAVSMRIPMFPLVEKRMLHEFESNEGMKF